MKLRSQMLVAAVLTMIVPIVGWQSIKQLYIALQQTRIDEQTLQVANMRLALAESIELKNWKTSSSEDNNNMDWYAEKSRHPIFLDGYDDDWKTLSGQWYQVFQNGSDKQDQGLSSLSSASQLSKSRFKFASDNNQLYIFVNVVDDQFVYHRIPLLNPSAGEGELPDRFELLVNGDALEIVLNDPSAGTTHALFRAIAPGPASLVTGSDKGGVLAGSHLTRWQGYLSRTSGGYQLEMRMPLPAIGSTLGLAFVDVDENGADRSTWVGNFDPATVARGDVFDSRNTYASLYYPSDGLQKRLEAGTQEGFRVRLFDSRGWLIADVNKLYASIQDDLAEEQDSSIDGLLDAILLRLFSLLIADDLPLLPETRTVVVPLQLSEDRRALAKNNEPFTARYVTAENDRVLGTLSTIGEMPSRVYLLLEANEEHASAYAGSQLARLFSLLLLTSIVVGAALLVFASILSSRIRRLSVEAQRAVSADGRVSGLTASDSRDEIGDLSRNLSGLLTRSAQYTQYLEALAGRLSHELRTPLSVVRTSLENLDTPTLDQQSQTLVQRAQGGTDQLGRIIKALVDSARLEQSVQGVEKERIDLFKWLQACAIIYRQIHPHLKFIVQTEKPTVMMVNASPVLLQQALDKLVDNAVSFSTSDTVVLELSRSGSAISGVANLAVLNLGKPIDEDHAIKLFDPLVSHRESSTNAVHLGLGLYMVRLIAEEGGGRVFSRNQNEWVVFGLSLPVT